MNKPIDIALPSLVQRIGGDNVKQAKAMAQQYDCQLKRVRRSRNWLMHGDAKMIQSCVLRLKADKSETFKYLIHKIEASLLTHADKLEPLAVKLQRLMAQNPSMTLTELIQLTNCTEAEARVARFNAEV